MAANRTVRSAATKLADRFGVDAEDRKALFAVIEAECIDDLNHRLVDAAVHAAETLIEASDATGSYPNAAETLDNYVQNVLIAN